MRWLIVVVGIAGCVLAGAAWLPAPQARALADPLDVARQAVDAMNRGDVDAQLALFAEDATIEGFPYCETPCTGTRDIGEELQGIVAAHVHVTVTSEEVSGNTAISRFEATSDILRQLQIERVLGTFTVTVKGDKIVASTFELDPSDPQTARVLAMFQDAPQPDPTEPVAPVLPDTGAGAEGTSSRGWSLTAGTLLAIGAVAIALAVGANVLAGVRRD